MTPPGTRRTVTGTLSSRAMRRSFETLPMLEAAEKAERYTREVRAQAERRLAELRGETL
jgi:hypothetical protein